MRSCGHSLVVTKRFLEKHEPATRFGSHACYQLTCWLSFDVYRRPAASFSPALNSPSTPKPVLPQVFPRPRGKNGLEFYLRAIDMSHSRKGISSLAASYPNNMNRLTLADTAEVIKTVQFLNSRNI